MDRPAGRAVTFLLAFLLPAALLECGGDDLLLPSGGGRSVTMEIVKGNGQSGAPGTMLPDSIIVRLTDSAGAPVARETVEFVPDTPGAHVAPETAVTDTDGTAAASWVLDTIPGPQEVVARVLRNGAPAGLQVRFTASATTTGSVPTLAIRTQPSSTAQVGEVLARQPVVQIRDATGNEAGTSGVPVTAAIASGSGSLGGTTTQLTGGNGRAVFTDLSIEGDTGSHVLIFAAPGYTSVVADPIEVSAAQNQPPVAVDDQYQTFEGGEKTLHVDAADGVLQNDEDPEGGTLTASLASDPSNGRVTLERDGSFSYTPDFSFYGDDQFTYTASDPSGAASGATVTIHVEPINDRPRFTIAVNPVEVPAGQVSRTVPDFVTGISPGAPNESGQILTFDVVSNSNPGLFAAPPVVTRDNPASTTGTLTFTPAAGRTGSATVRLIMRDNGGTANGGKDTSHTATFTIRVG